MIILKHKMIVLCFRMIVLNFRMNNPSVRVHFFNLIVQTILPVRGENFTGESIVLNDLTYSLNIKESAEPVWARLIS